MKVPKRDWRAISVDLQLKEIPIENIPRLLHECIVDLNSERDWSAGLVRDIESTTTRLREQIEKRTNEDRDMDQDMFVTEKIAAGYMIQRKNPTAWFTPEGTWEQSIFEGAAFKEQQDAESVLAEIKKQLAKTS